MKLKKEINGSMIKTYFDSSNVLYSEYDRKQQELIVVFKQGKTYKYSNVPHNTFVKFERAQSQGKFLNKEIKPNFDYEKIDDYDISDIDQKINELMKKQNQ